MSKVVIAGRTFWIFAGVVYTTLADAIQARDGAR
ncbi:MAG: hypothetical protein RL272_1140 [Candidatus Parcubacteria bacterium]|jgi:hypothetical protein